MDLILTRIAHLEEQARLQASSIAQLKTENEAQRSALTRLSSKIQVQASSTTRLSLENETFKSVTKDQDLVIGELSRTSIPEGFWVWESRRKGGKEEEGRWLWSLEKYKVFPPPSVASGPSTSLLSLPNELLNTILGLLFRTSHLSLLRVSYRLMEVASSHVYGRNVHMGGKEAAKFVLSRIAIVDGQPAKSDRISRLLVPHKLQLDWDEGEHPPSTSASKKLARLLATTQRRSSLDINTVCVTLFDYSHLSNWAVLLSVLNPKSFQLWVGEFGHGFHTVPPTVEFVSQDFVDSFASQWTRLESFAALGPESVLLVEGSKSTSVFEACLRRCSPDLPFVQADLWTKTWEDVEMLEELDAEDIPGFLEDVVDCDWGMRLVSLDLKMRKTRR